MSDAERIIRNVRKFIVVLNCNFFSGFFIQNEETGSWGPNRDSSTLKELELAFQYGCDFYPVFSGEFSWKSVGEETMQLLREYYGEDNLNKLKNRANPYVWSQVDNPREKILENLSRIGLDGLLHFLRSAGNEDSRDYELALTAFAKSQNTSAIRAWLYDLLAEKTDGEIQYAAFYTLQVMLRQQKDLEELAALFESYREVFSGHPSFNHIWVLCILEGKIEFDDNELMEMAYRDVLTYPENAGYIHLFADVFATVCEKEDVGPENDLFKEWYSRAADATDRAIELDPSYAKFLCTKARIKALCGEYSEAERLIERAVALEDSKRGDYVIRLAYYQYHKTIIQVRKMLSKQQKREAKT